MAFLHGLFRRTRVQSSDSRDSTATANRPPAVEDTRQYLAHSLYQLPKDEEEAVRLDFQHHALFHALGTHYVVPLSPPLALILDVGAGTGIWANEMARVFPHSTVIGLDLAATSFKQPTQANCLLRVGDVLTGLPFPDRLFAYTHQRLLVAGIPAARWPGVVAELVRVTQIQGWVELVEIDDQMQHAGPATARMQALMQEISSSMGFAWEVIRHLDELLRKEGLQHVEFQPIPVPVGDWAGRVGGMMKRNLLAATNAVRGRYCTQAGISGATFDQMAQAMAEEWEVCHPACTFFVASGKRVHL